MIACCCMAFGEAELMNFEILDGMAGARARSTVSLEGSCNVWCIRLTEDCGTMTDASGNVWKSGLIGTL